jgi:hypothetical protein
MFIPNPRNQKDPDPGSGSATLPLCITSRTSCINLIHPFKNKCVPEGEVDPLLLAGRILGNAVEPVLLHRALHQQQRPGEQRETDEVRRSLNSKKHQEKNAGRLQAAGGLSGVICRRLAANFARGWRPIWRYLHAAGGPSGSFACGWLPIWRHLHAAGGPSGLFACGWLPIWRYLHAAGGPSGDFCRRLVANFLAVPTVPLAASSMQIPVYMSPAECKPASVWQECRRNNFFNKTMGRSL